MFGRQSARNRQDHHATYGPHPATESSERSWAPDRRQLRGQLDLVQQVVREGPWYF